ncbi:hypothetical protein MTO96_017212 [Rhipicephalus appendiculatus]
MKGRTYKKAALTLPIAGAVVFVVAVLGLLSTFMSHGIDELGAAAKMTADDTATTDNLLAFRRALDAERLTDRPEPMPTDRARSGGASNGSRRNDATRSGTKIRQQEGDKGDD